jgi:hypothetical protein
MRVNGFVVHGAVTAAVFASGVGAAIVGTNPGGVTLAGPQVLRLIQNAPAALSSYPSVKLTLKVNVSLNGRSQSIDETADISPDGKSGTFAVHLPNGAGTLSALAVDNTIYMHASQQSVTNFGKRWVGLSISTASPASPAQAPNGNDALSFLHLMPGATGEVQQLGHDKIDGVRTTHYRVTIDIAKAEQSMPASFHQASAGQLAALGLTRLPLDVWLDAENKLRQEKLTFDVQHEHFSMQLKLSGSSSPVNVTAPPASDVHFVATATELVADAIQH